MPHPRYVCIHGHFYQPPRENPWLNAVEVEDSGAPYHDWNERITRECYAPNTRSRLLDGQGRIVQPPEQLRLDELQLRPDAPPVDGRAPPDVHHGIVEADRSQPRAPRRARQRAGEIYNHIIMPLASRRDKEAQVNWGIADFRQRFGRHPGGDVAGGDGGGRRDAGGPGRGEDPVHDPAASAGAAVAEAGGEGMGGDPRRDRPVAGVSVPAAIGAIDRPVLLRRDVSQDVAFRRLLDDGERFLQRIFQGFDDRREHAQLMHIATDGESYGHHHPHGDMALAYVLERLGRHPDVRVTNYGEYLERHPPEWEVEVHENSSWSCAWGGAVAVGLRLPVPRRLATAVAGAVAAGARRAEDAARPSLQHPRPGVLPRPLGARDGYIRVILADDREQAIGDFLRKHGHPDLDESQVTDALRLLEMQQDAMLMFTSCGWFHDELSGIETVQCLQYAARAMNLAHSSGGISSRNSSRRCGSRPATWRSIATAEGSGNKWSGRAWWTWSGSWPIMRSA